MTDCINEGRVVDRQLRLPLELNSAIGVPFRRCSMLRVTEKARRAVAVAIVVRGTGLEKRVLLVKRAADGDVCPRWVFPGGKVETGESVRSAAKRELREETGLYAKKPKLIGSRVHPISGANLYYVAFRKLSDLQAYADDEKINERRWVHLDQIDNYFDGTLFSKVAAYLGIGDSNQFELGFDAVD